MGVYTCLAHLALQVSVLCWLLAGMHLQIATLGFYRLQRWAFCRANMKTISNQDPAYQLWMQTSDISCFQILQGGAP